jgi:xanthine dehydrogenase accessory factor
MLVTKSGLYWGTVGGGKIEAHAINYAQGILSEEGKSHAREWNLQKDIGMSCGGEVTLFFDINQALIWNVAVFGAGHVSQEVCRVLTTWTCQVSVFDTRPDWLERLPISGNLEKKISANLGQEVAALPKGTFLLCLTQGHAADVPVLFEAFKKPQDFSFIGAIGSEVKAGKIKSELIAMGSPKEAVDKLVCPVGLPIGDNTPSEIAISIAAQLLAVRDHSSFKVERGLS